MRRIVTWPEVLVLAWIVLAGVGMALAASMAMEPPSHDPLSYTVKAFGFWDGVTHGRMVNPLGLGPNVRPPGTIFISFPFGFSLDFRWYYFRTCFVPLVLLVAAVYIVGYEPEQTRRQRWMLAALAIVLGGMPTLYQFQHNDMVQAASFWGLVDNFIAGASAVAMAAAIRGVWTRSWLWTLFAALAAAFCLMIKPSGILIMALVGVTWLLLLAAQMGWRVSALREDPALAAYARKSLISAVIVYVIILGASFLSPYFSPTNMVYGSTTLKVISATGLSILRFNDVRAMLHVGPGFIILFVTSVGIILSLAHKTTWMDAVAAVLCLAVGVAFWFAADLVLVRYFLPFVSAAFIAVTPALLAYGSRPSKVFAAGTALVAAPTLVMAALLFVPAPPLRVQDELGINLATNVYQPENDQGAALMARMKDKNEPDAAVYVFNATPPLRNFTGGLIFPSVILPGPKPEIRMPMDWQRATTFRVEEMVTSRYIAFEPMTDAAARAAALKTTGKTFDEEFALMTALLTDAAEADGVCPLSATRVRVVEVCDSALFKAALARFAQTYAWTPAFHEANGP